MRRHLFLFGFLGLLLSSGVRAQVPGDPVTLTLQSRMAAGQPETKSETWKPAETALIICDMWDLHHCLNAVRREGEMVPRFNEFVENARKRGMFIIHAPSDCMKAYEGQPARKRAQEAPKAANLPREIGNWCSKIPAEEKAVYPIDQTDGGEDDDPAEHQAWAEKLKGMGLNPRAPWTHQHKGIRIDQEKDAISDSGVEVWNLLEARKIKNVMLLGVHVNMCVSGRPFGMRQMARNGKNVVLVRDLTDAMYNPARWPYVSHHEGTQLFIKHAEKHICPTITSDQLLGGKRFQFQPVTQGEVILPMKKAG